MQGAIKDEFFLVFLFFLFFYKIEVILHRLHDGVGLGAGLELLEGLEQAPGVDGLQLEEIFAVVIVFLYPIIFSLVLFVEMFDEDAPDLRVDLLEVLLDQDVELLGVGHGQLDLEHPRGHQLAELA